MYTVEINWLGILYAVIASLAISMVWYGIFAKPWAAAVGKKAEDLKQGQIPGWPILTTPATV